ncbi:MAG: hypothetical protein V4541_12745 [Bacteroidota bacterium]
MKKFLFFGLLIAASFLTYAQTDSVTKDIQKKSEAIGHGGNNEVKINLLFTVIGIPEVSYERIMADNMGLGVSVLLGLDQSITYKYAITPYYRLYFGGKKANGFFIEGNASVISARTRGHLYFDNNGMYQNYREATTNLGMGAAAGAKFLTRNGFLGEAYLGVGRVFGERRYEDAYPRIGITIGKRF